MQPLLPILPLLTALLLLQNTTATAQDAGWFSDFESARKLATQNNATLLVHVYGPQCPPCLRMERDVFTVPQIQAALTRGIVAVKLNGDANPSLIRELGVRSYPADVIFKPGLPREVRHRPHSTQEYLVLLNSIAAPVPTNPQNPSRTVNEPVISDTRREDVRNSGVQAPPPSKNASQQSAPKKQTRTANKSADGGALNTSIVGLDGFCPVTLQQRRVLTPGKPELFVDHEGVRYQFASARLRDLFSSDPSRYAPAVQGCDPITLAREQRAVPGSIRYGVWYAGKLFLFQSEANKQTFKASPPEWTKIQSAANPPARVRR
jgi:YHS domain-containing protein/thiol-disulfide isomerase/thioredoxin